ncbi:hypothetical protein [Streptomyces sp. YIM 98790]|uniref:hypothetical protein n=1 Tax=Streptomyces sp. YIM 98790 TaxID=2689077 RepID=UPI001A9EDF75|nr:hypothetical protein [Streptomyces sp. YIM 98790]
MREFLMDLDAGMEEFFRDIARFMTDEFGIPYAEAVARLNAAFERSKFDPYPDIMCHESPAYWGFGLYYRRLPDGSEVPWWEPDADRSGWEIKDAPPPDAHHWTLPADAEAPEPSPGLLRPGGPEPGLYRPVPEEAPYAGDDWNH